MKELVIISGKGGTGKTTITACFASLFENKVMADADVDAADLFILLDPEVKQKTEFRSGVVAQIDPELCVQCDACRSLCRFDAITEDYRVDPVSCEGCGLCARICPEEAVELKETVSGEWYISDTKYGPFVHARLGVGEENSGKLVTVVRHNAKLLAEEQGLDWIVVDGPPGIGCPVIASITGSDAVLIVTEPTLSGVHDMKRVAELAAYFHIPTAVCINKWDLNPEMTDRIEAFCAEKGIIAAGRVPYDRVVYEALVKRKILVEHAPDSPVAAEIRKVCGKIMELAAGSGKTRAKSSAAKSSVGG